jgi:hypothetical protein
MWISFVIQLKIINNMNQRNKKCIDCKKEKSDKGLYCKSCGYKHRKRPKGLKYIHHKENPTSFKKGSSGFNGRHSESTKIKLRNFNKGKHNSIKTEFRKENTTGKNHWNWQGGITPDSQRIRRSIEMDLWRQAVFARDNYTCQKYGTRGVKLHPHHILNFSSNIELRFAIDNGITLSKKAHEEFHKIYGTKNNTMEQLEEFLGRIIRV